MGYNGFGTSTNVLTSGGSPNLPTFQSGGGGSYVSLAQFIVGPTGASHCDFAGDTAIQDAINAASGPTNIYIKPGTYVPTSNLITLADGINLIGFSGESFRNGLALPDVDSVPPTVIIQGQVQYVGGKCRIENVYFQKVSGSGGEGVVQMQHTGSLYLANCKFLGYYSGGPDYIFYIQNSGSVNFNLFIDNCVASFDSNSGNIVYNASDTTIVQVNNSYFSAGSGGSWRDTSNNSWTYVNNSRFDVGTYTLDAGNQYFQVQGSTLDFTGGDYVGWGGTRGFMNFVGTALITSDTGPVPNIFFDNSGAFPIHFENTTSNTVMQFNNGTGGALVARMYDHVDGFGASHLWDPADGYNTNPTRALQRKQAMMRGQICTSTTNNSTNTITFNIPDTSNTGPDFIVVKGLLAWTQDSDGNIGGMGEFLANVRGTQNGGSGNAYTPAITNQGSNDGSFFTVASTGGSIVVSCTGGVSSSGLNWVCYYELQGIS